MSDNPQVPKSELFQIKKYLEGQLALASSQVKDLADQVTQGTLRERQVTVESINIRTNFMAYIVGMNSHLETLFQMYDTNEPPPEDEVKKGLSLVKDEKEAPRFQ